MERRGIPKKALNSQRSTFNFSIPDSQPFVPALEYLKVELLKVESFQRVPGEGVHSVAVLRCARWDGSLEIVAVKMRREWRKGGWPAGACCRWLPAGRWSAMYRP